MRARERAESMLVATEAERRRNDQERADGRDGRIELE
jgi:hypothetical protein